MAEVLMVALPIAVSAALHNARVRRWEARGPLGYKGRGAAAAGVHIGDSSTSGRWYRRQPKALPEPLQPEARLVANSRTELHATVECIRAAPATNSWLAGYQPAITGQRFLAKSDPFVVLQLGEQVRRTPPLNNLEQAASWTSLSSPFMVGQQLDFDNLPAAGTPLQLQAFLYARRGDCQTRLVALAAVSVDTLPATGQPLSLELPMFERHGRQCGSIKLALHSAPKETDLVPSAPPQKMLPALEEPTASAVEKIPPPIVVLSGDWEPSIAMPEADSKKTRATSRYPSLL